MTSYVLREWFVTSSLHLILMACGAATSFPSVLAPALGGNVPDLVVTEDDIHYILGIYTLGTLIGFMVSPMIMQSCGRKITIVGFCLCLIVGSVTIAMATSAKVLIIGRAIQGLALASHFIGTVMVAEYTHPRRRGFYIVIKGVSGGFGEFLCRFLGLTVLTIRQAALLPIIPAILSIMITLKWPESPQFLAYKGRYEECTTAFEWMRGTDPESKKELLEIILSQKERKKLDTESFFTRFRQAACSKGFWVPMFIIFLLNVLFQFSGYLFISSYATEMIYVVTGDRNQAFHYSLALDILKMLSICVSSVIVRVVKRRTLLFSSGSVACVVMVAICAFYYSYRTDLITAKWLTPSMFVIYYFIVNVATAPATVVIQAEMIPVKYKGVGTFTAGTMMMTLGLIPMSFTWKMVTVLDVHGTFGVYLLICSVAYMMLHILLPETKDRTLQDIDKEFCDRYRKYDAIQLEK